MSDFYNKYPYTDFHELNLDWVIERVKKLTEDWLATQAEWNDTEEQWQQLHDYVMNYFDNLDVSQEINDKIDSMIADGTFLSTIRSTVEAQTITTTTSWLADHITQPTTPVVDTSLSIAGAAADSKTVGDNFTGLNDFLTDEIPLSFEVGAIVSGNPVISNKYARSSEFLIARKDATLSIDNHTSFNLDNMFIYYYSDASFSTYIAEESISGVAVGATGFHKLTHSGYFKIRVSQPDALVDMTPSDISDLNNTYTVNQLYCIEMLKDDYTGLVNSAVNAIDTMLYDPTSFKFEIGAIVGGAPAPSTKYLRFADFGISREGALVTITNQTDFTIDNFAIYYYTAEDHSTYFASAALPDMAPGDTYSFKLEHNGFFKLRLSQPDALTDMDAADVTAAENSVTAQQLYAVDLLRNEFNNKLNTEVTRIDSNVDMLMKNKYIANVSAANEYAAFYCKKNDSITIKTPDGSKLIGTLGSAIRFYDKNKQYLSYYGIGPEHGNSRTFTFSNVNDAYYIAISENEALTVINNTRVGYAETNIYPMDYITIAGYTSGKFSIALQTDTHVSLTTNYDNIGTVYQKSNFATLERIFNGINKINPNMFINLGDIVRGYEFDPDYETRASIDKYMQTADEHISSDKLFIVGNHDDDTMWYNSTYNQKKNVSDLLYPNEQFNRIIKYGLNSNKNKNYSYHDVSGIRFICLDQKDFDYPNTPPGINDFQIGSTQLSWLENDALNTSLPVVILTHAPLSATLFAAGGTGFTDALTSIETFKANGGTVIAVLSGHTHVQNYVVENNINHIVFANGYTWFELITIDLVNSQIICRAILRTLADITLSF